jgi:hypothetical protein
MANEPSFPAYADFWPFYLGQHRRRATRLFHITGTLLALLAILNAVANLDIGWLLAAPFIGYGFAWAAHMFIEKNHPATFAHPLWSLRGDFHLLWLWLTGQLEGELMRRGIMT